MGHPRGHRAERGEAVGLHELRLESLPLGDVARHRERRGLPFVVEGNRAHLECDDGPVVLLAAERVGRRPPVFVDDDPLVDEEKFGLLGVDEPRERHGVEGLRGRIA